MNYSKRRTKLSALLKTKNIQDFLITDLHNIFYLTGFNGTNALLWHKLDGDYLFITDPRYAGQAKALCHTQNIELFIYSPGNLEALIAQFPKKLHIEDALTLKELNIWKTKAPEIDFVVTSDLVQALRIKKDKDEIALIQKAQHHVDNVLQKTFPQLIQKGISEKALAFKLEQALMESGNYGLSFPSIVAFSENSAIPHHQGGDRKLKPGDNILVDCGVILQGYCSDITRNFSFGSPSSEYLRQYEELLKAQEASLGMIKGGKLICEIDQICREQLGKEEPFFTHSLGHGVGINVHEEPRVSGKDLEALLENNMIITIEPGVYYEGKFGIRIEDLVWVQKDGCEILSQCPKDLIIL